MTITYTPQYRLANLGSFTSVPSTTLTTATFGSLAAGTSYDFRVIADNGIGQSTSVPFTQITTAVSESAQNASITQSNYTTSFIYDANLVQWSLQTPNSFSIYSSPPPYTSIAPVLTTSSVTLLLYWNHIIYQQNSSGNWWSWTGTAWNPTSDPRPTIVSVNLTNSSFPQGASAGTVVGNVTVTENTGNTFAGTLGVTGTNSSFFTINASNQLVTVGNVPAGGPWSINIVATSNQLAVQNSPFSQPESITETSAESIEGTVVNTIGPIMSASPNFGQAATGTLNQFELQTSASSGNQIYYNPGSGFVLTSSGNVTQLVYHNHSVFQNNTGGGWWYWNTTIAFPASNPWTGFSVDSVALGATTYPTGATAGRQIGVITIGETGDTFGGTFGGTLALSGTNASSFAISGNNLVVAPGVTLSTNTATNYSFTITATVASGGASPTTIGTKNTGTITLTNSAAVTATIPDLRPQAVKNAGFNTAVFVDDFTSLSTITTSTSTGVTTGINWYPGYSSGNVKGTNWDMLTTTTAATISSQLGSTDNGGTGASTAGGIFVIWGRGISGGNSNWQTVPVSNNQGPLTWKHAYFEAYITFNPDGVLSWTNFPVAFWSWPYNSGPGAEIDFYEQGNSSVHTNTTSAVNNSTSVPVVSSAGISQDGRWAVAGPGIVGIPRVTFVNGNTLTLSTAQTLASGVTLRFYYPPSGGNIVDPPGSKQVYTVPNPAYYTAPAWILLGCLWTDNGNGTGTVAFYYNGVLQGSSTMGTGTSAPDGEATTGQIVVLGNGWGNTPMYVDWVRVWK